MAIDDVPDDLRYLARVVPPITMAILEPVELLLRLEYAARLVGLADLADESEARRLRREARRILEAKSIGELADAEADLRERISAAIRDGDDNLAAYLGERAEALLRDNPQLPEDYMRDAELSQLIRRTQKIKSQSAASRPRWSPFKRRK